MVEVKFAKVINENTYQVQIGVAGTEELYRSLGMVEMEVEQGKDGNWYLAGHTPQKSEKEIIEEQIFNLESQVTARNLRGATLGDEFALNKIAEIEAQIEELRKQLPKEAL